MALMEWNNSFCTGVTKFDNDHKKLVELINKLHDAMKNGMGSSVVGEILDALVTYTKTHFDAEEQLMKVHNYPDYATQKKEHTALVLQVSDIQKKFATGTALPMNLMQFMKDWLTTHIMGDDKKYGPFFASKGIR